MKWEYTWETGNRSDLSLKINKLGAKKWECYSVTAQVAQGMSSGDYTAFLKRPIEEPDAEEQHIDAVEKAREEYRRRKMAGW
jgi:hypothetical protein